VLETESTTKLLQAFANITQRSNPVITAGSVTFRETAEISHPACEAAPTYVEQRNLVQVLSEQNSCPLEKYDLIKHIYSGAEAEIYLAQYKLDAAPAVLKLYHNGIFPDPAVLERLSLYPSPQLVNIVEHGVATTSQYYEVIEHIHQGDLLTLRGTVRLPEITCKILLQQLSSTIAHLHTPDTENRIIVHRDIKPANVLIRTVLPFEIALCDFGISTLLDTNISEHRTCRNCTPRYASPEQFRGEVSAACDYWSLGILMYEVLTGAHPLAEYADDQIPSLLGSGWQPDVSNLKSDWQRLIVGLTEIEPARRWGRLEVESWLNETTSERFTKSDATEEDLFQFQDLKSYSALELAARLALHWRQTAPLLDDEMFQHWLGHELTRLPIGKTIDQLIDAPGPAADIKLLRLIYRLAPSMSYVWKEWRLRRTDMAEYCINAMNGDDEQRILVEELFVLAVFKELSVLCNDQELSQLFVAWHGAAQDYKRIVAEMISMGAPTDQLPPHGSVLPALYLLECENGAGINLFDTVLTAQLLFFNPWFEPLCSSHAEKSSSAQQFLRSVFLPNCVDRNKQNFRIYHEGSATSQRVEGVPGQTFGWNPPTIAISAEYVDYVMTVGNDKTVVAKGVHLRWEVRNALLVHLTGFGLVRSEGERPNARMAQTTVYRVVHDCPCDDHNSAWFAVTETTVFSIRAVNLLGYSSMQLPPIIVPQPELELECHLKVRVPDFEVVTQFEIVTQLEVTPTPQFEPKEELFQSASFQIPKFTKDALPETGPLKIPAFSKRDIWPEYYSKIDEIRDKLRFRKRGAQ